MSSTHRGDYGTAGAGDAGRMVRKLGREHRRRQRRATSTADSRVRRAGRRVALASAFLASPGLLTGCSDDSVPPPPRPASFSGFAPCAFFTDDEKARYNLTVSDVGEEARCQWFGPLAREKGTMWGVLTLDVNDAVGAESKAGSLSLPNTYVNERKPINQRRIWRVRINTKGAEACSLLYDAGPSTFVALTLGQVSAAPAWTSTQICERLEQIAKVAEQKLPPRSR